MINHEIRIPLLNNQDFFSWKVRDLSFFFVRVPHHGNSPVNPGSTPGISVSDSPNVVQVPIMASGG